VCPIRRGYCSLFDEIRRQRSGRLSAFSLSADAFPTMGMSVAPSKKQQLARGARTPLLCVELRQRKDLSCVAARDIGYARATLSLRTSDDPRALRYGICAMKILGALGCTAHSASVARISSAILEVRSGRSCAVGAPALESVSSSEVERRKGRRGMSACAAGLSRSRGSARPVRWLSPPG